jgi:hypothetical protein
LKRLRAATVEELAAVPGISRKLAGEIEQALTQLAPEPRPERGGGRLKLVRRARAGDAESGVGGDSSEPRVDTSSLLD